MLEGYYLECLRRRQEISDDCMSSQSGLWYPTIYPDRCDGCAGKEVPKCVAFCEKNVFEVRDGKAVVVRPQNCVYGCIACEFVCPRKAIAFPQRIASLPKVKMEDKGLLHRVKCVKCGKIFLTNRDTNICMDCEEKVRS